VSDAVFLDAGPLGILSNPKNTGSTSMARQSLGSLHRAARRVLVPEIADYEVRRELVRINSGAAASENSCPSQRAI
jgi:hypothetical protein